MTENAGFVTLALQDGPMSRDELGISHQEVYDLERIGIIAIDPDPWPDEHVPGNPLILRLPGDERPWPGWQDWNL